MLKFSLIRSFFSVRRLLFTLALSLFSVGLLAPTGVAYAHQQKQAFSTLLFNVRTNNLEVSHRFLLHDAEHILSTLFAEKSDLVQDKKSRDRFADYIQQNFELQTTGKQALELTTVGNEVEGKYFWVYQEMQAPEPQSLRIKHTSLQEVWPSQINYLNLERNGEVRSLRIDSSQQWYQLTIP